MALSAGQKKWAIGGSIGAIALLVGYELFHSRPAFAFPVLPAAHPHEKHGHHKHKKRGHAEHDRESNARGEYGGKKKHHHRGHKHGG